MKLTNIIIACLLSACSVHPFMVSTPNGNEYASLGGSFMTKNLSEASSITKRDGTQITYNSQGKDETMVPKAYIFGQVAKVGIIEGAGVSKAAINAPVVAGKTNLAAPVVGAAAIGTAAVMAPGKPAPAPLVPPVTSPANDKAKLK